MATDDWSGGLPLDHDWILADAPDFDWIREGTSFWLFEDNGAFGIPRNGIEAEPHVWDSRRYQANFAFEDGRILQDVGVGKMGSPFDAKGRSAILSAGPITYQCIEPFKKWRVSYDGHATDTHIKSQIASSVDASKKTALKYDIELTMIVPAFVQDVSPGKFFKLGKGQQRDALSVGLGWRFEQLMTGEGELKVDGKTQAFKCSGMRVKRRSVRTDGLFLRGHAWQTAVFQDGRAFGYMNYPPHDDGLEPWTEGFVYQGGRMHSARVKNASWLRQMLERGDDVSVEMESDLGVTRIKGSTTLTTCRVGSKELWGLNLQQTGVCYEWDGQVGYGMLERSMPTSKMGSTSAIAG